MTNSRTFDVPGYQVVQFLGNGACSSIWQVKDCRTGQMLALKRVVRRYSSDRRYLQQAANEYAVGRRFNHPAVRRMHAIRRIRPWLAVRELQLFMEYCPGRTLQDALLTDVGEIVRVFRVVADALIYINATGFVHADMKPNNIVVAPDGTVKVIDLGQSCPLGTIKKRIQGTPDFIAPEQVHRGRLDGRTDVFNFGAALYWTLTGKAIPTILPRRAVRQIISDFVVVPPDRLNSKVPTALGKLVVDCVELDAGRRPQSMSEVSARLDWVADVTRTPKSREEA